MRKHLMTIAAVSSAALLAACGTTTPVSETAYPVATPGGYSTTYPATTTYPSSTQVQTAPVAVEMGRVTDIQTVAMGASGNDNRTRNAVIGGVLGAVVGSAIGKNVDNGHSRAGTTVLGGVAGAAAGSRIGQNDSTASAGAGAPAYRVSVQTDQGVMRTYEVGALGDLRVGDRVRIENNVIYRAS